MIERMDSPSEDCGFWGVAQTAKAVKASSIFCFTPLKRGVTERRKTAALRTLAFLAGGFLLLPSVALAQSNAPAATPPAAVSAAARVTAASPHADAEKASLEKHAKPILDQLKISDASKQATVHDTLVAHFDALKAWHEKNDPQIKNQWGQFNKARSGQDQTKADGIMSQIDAVYATFKPQHDEFLAKLATALTPAQIETIKDNLTVNKVKVTFNAYGQIFHGLTDEQKAFILKNLQAAREEAIDAGAMTEKSAFFKKYKIKIEAYLTAQGYDVKQSYKEFVEKQKGESVKE